MKNCGIYIFIVALLSTSLCLAYDPYEREFRAEQRRQARLYKPKPKTKEPRISQFYNRPQTALATGKRAQFCEIERKKHAVSPTEETTRLVYACDVLGEQQRKIEEQAYEITTTLCYKFKIQEGMISNDQIDQQKLNSSNELWKKILREGVSADFDEKKQFRRELENWGWWQLQSEVGSNYVKFLTGAPGFTHGLQSCFDRHGLNFTDQFKIYNKFLTRVHEADVIGGAVWSGFKWAGIVTFDIWVGGYIVKGLGALHRMVGSPITRSWRWLKSFPERASFYFASFTFLTGDAEVPEKSGEEQTLDNIAEAVTAEAVAETQTKNAPEVSTDRLQYMIESKKSADRIREFLEHRIYYGLERIESNLPLEEFPDFANQNSFLNDSNYSPLLAEFNSCLKSEFPEDCLEDLGIKLNALVVETDLDWQLTAQYQIRSESLIEDALEYESIQPGSYSAVDLKIFQDALEIFKNTEIIDADSLFETELEDL